MNSISNENRIREGLGLKPIKQTREQDDDPITGKLPKERKEPAQKKKIGEQKPLKETTVYKGIKAIYKSATKNHIPKEHDKVIAMLKRLEKEEQERKEIEDAKDKIKEIQKRNKEINHQKKLARRAKIRKVLHL